MRLIQMVTIHLLIFGYPHIHITFLYTYYISMHFLHGIHQMFLRDVMRRVRVPLTIFLERFPIRKKVSGTHAMPHTMRTWKKSSK
jgi:hypothetical protein